mgnify:CR=1 FL=1
MRDTVNSPDERTRLLASLRENIGTFEPSGQTYIKNILKEEAKQTKL